MEDLNALTGLYLPPRLIRLRDAPRYLGMDKNRFNREVRPHIISVPIGKQGIAFDRLDLDKWIDEYKQSHGKRPWSEQLPNATPSRPEGSQMLTWPQRFKTINPATGVLRLHPSGESHGKP